MALTEKQIYNRMNRCYENFLEGDVYQYTDEWYGSDNPLEWVFYRPSNNTTYRMELELETKDIHVGKFQGVSPYSDLETACEKLRFRNNNY